MANRRFCDRCDAPIVPADDQPFIRQDVEKGIQIALLITGINGITIVPDICVKCKQEIVIDGTPLPTEPAQPAPEGQPIPFLHKVPKIMQITPTPAASSSSAKPPVFESSFTPSEAEEKEKSQPPSRKRKAAIK